MEPIVWNQIKHLYEVEKLSIRQIAQKLRRARKTVARVIHNERVMRSYPDSMLRPYGRLRRYEVAVRFLGDPDQTLTD